MDRQINIQFKDGYLRPKTAELGRFGAKWHNDGNGTWWVSLPESRVQDLTEWYGNLTGVGFDRLENVPQKPSKLPVKPAKPPYDGGRDLSDLINAIASEFKRIGLSVDDRKALTQNRYGKTSREMSEAELTDYLSHLKTFPDGGETIPLHKEKPKTNQGVKVYQYRYAEKGIIYLVKQFLWETHSGISEGLKTEIPKNEDGSVDEARFTDIAIRYLENPDELPQHIKTILEIHSDGKTGRSFIQLWAAEKLIRKTTELMDELAEVRGVDRKEIDREMISWAESMQFPRRQQMSNEQLRATIVYLTDLLNPVDDDPFNYGDEP
jgi:hypothetical protein